MFANVSKLSAPIAGAILLVSAGFITTASAAPLVGKTQIEPAKAELVVKVDHRRGNGRGGNWNGRHGGRHRGHEIAAPTSCTNRKIAAPTPCAKKTKNRFC